MADPSAAAVWLRLNAWPQGYFTARYNDRRYGVTNARHAGGRRGPTALTVAACSQAA